MSAGQGFLTGILTDPGLRSLRWTMWTGLMLLVLVSSIPEVWNSVAHPVAVVALIVVWAATWWRPLDADAAGAMVFLIGGLQVVLLDGALMADVIVLFALFRLGEQGRRRLQPVWLLLLVAGCTAAAVSWTQDERGEQTYRQSLVMLLLLTSTMGLLAWAGGRMIGQGRNIVRARAGEEKARRAEREQRRQAEAAALRTEIAGEVHDVVGHALALIAVQAEAARHLATVDAGETDLSDEQRLAQVGGAVETVLVTARGALAETRALTRSLVAAPDDASSTSTALLHPTPGLADLPALVRSAADAGAPVELELRAGPGGCSDAATGLGTQAQLALYRVAQEGITNAVRHAPGADSIIVELIHGLDDVVLRVSDDDPHGGLPVDECRGQGLRTLRRRVETAGGDLRIGSRSGGGVLLEARMPAGTDSAVDEDGVASGREGAAS